MHRSAHVDQFARDNLPPQEEWPALNFTLPELAYPERLNCAVQLLDRHVAEGRGGRTAVIGPDGLRWTYADLAGQVNRITNVLVAQGLRPGERVLLRAANTPMMVASYFAVLKAGGIVVASMPLLRAKELRHMLRKAQIAYALCDQRLTEELELARDGVAGLRGVLQFQSPEAPAELERLMQAAPAHFAACDTAQDDVCLIAFTSGTTGEPKGTMHFHRDLLAICDTFSRHVLRPGPDDLFLGSAPLAFTFGLGGSVLFPFHAGAAALVLERTTPSELMQAIARHRPTVLFTAPTTYRTMLAQADRPDLSSLKKCVSAGEALPRATWEAWREATGLRLIDGIGSTEMLHIFISAAEDDIRPGSTGRPVPGYQARIIGPDGQEVPDGTLGRLAVRGPTGCRYLADPRQRDSVQSGWNLTGDTFWRDDDGYFHYGARSDDMIVSSGYNIAGPEVEEALLLHGAVLACGVVGAPDLQRGHVVKAYIVLAPGYVGSETLAETLQAHVRAHIAPYKYPREIEFVNSLPLTLTGKLQRAELRAIAAREA